jgi:surface antigen
VVIIRKVNASGNATTGTIFGALAGGLIGGAASHRNGDYGAFRSTREFRRGGYICRDFHEVSYHSGRKYERNGTACRQTDGNWHFDD